MDADNIRFKTRTLAEFNGRAILSEEELAKRLGADWITLGVGSDAWLFRGDKTYIMRMKDIAPSLGLDFISKIVGIVGYDNMRYAVFA